MSDSTVIKRYLSCEDTELDTIAADLNPVVRNVNNTKGECTLELREDYFDIYYQGNAIATVYIPATGMTSSATNRTYRVKINSKFVARDPQDPNREPFEFDERLDTIKEYPRYRGRNSKYLQFKVSSGKLASFFRATHLAALCHNIRAVNYGEEIKFEQRVMTDNPPSNNLIIIDRQVREHGNRSQMDLLALVRDELTEPFRFLILELKLGRNRELESKVAMQLEGYVRRLREHICDYAACYQRNYERKKRLGLFPDDMPDTIVIDTEQNSVQGLILVGGYSRLGSAAITRLGEVAPDIRVHQFTYRLTREALQGDVLN